MKIDDLTLKFQPISLRVFQKLDQSFVAETDEFIEVLSRAPKSELLKTVVGETKHARRMLTSYGRELKRKLEFLEHKLSTVTEAEKAALEETIKGTRSVLSSIDGYLRSPSAMTYSQFFHLSEYMPRARIFELNGDAPMTELLVREREALANLKVQSEHNASVGLYSSGDQKDVYYVPTDRDLTIEEMNYFSDRPVVAFVGIAYTPVTADGIIFDPLLAYGKLIDPKKGRVDTFFEHDIRHGRSTSSNWGPPQDKGRLIQKTFENCPKEQEKSRQFIWFYFWHESVYEKSLSGYVGFLRDLRDPKSRNYENLMRRVKKESDFGSDLELRQNFETNLGEVSKAIENEVTRY